MNSITLNKINDRLKDIPEQFAGDIMQYLEFLFYKSKQGSKDYELSEEQINLLEERSNTPIEDCIPAENLVKDLKKKYSV